MSQKEALRLRREILASKTKRIAYNDESIPVMGEAIVQCESSQKRKSVTFKLVSEHLLMVLGRKMCVEFSIIVRVQQVKETEETTTSTGLGCFNNFVNNIDLVTNSKLKIMPPRRIPHALKDQMKTEIYKKKHVNDSKSDKANSSSKPNGHKARGRQDT